MAFYDRQQQAATATTSRAVEFDAGLRAYMLRIYNYMASALIVTGLVAYFAGTSEAFLSMMVGADGRASALSYILMFAPLGIVFYLSARIRSLSEGAAQMWFWTFAVVMGLSLFYIFAAYTGVSIARVFFITAGTFGAMSLYGYTTKKDLTGMGSFLFMGLIGIILASLVNLFLQSSALHFAVSVIGVLVFVGLTAWDTQRLKNTYYMLAGSGAELHKTAIMGALSLYLDFINLFIMLLQLFGDRR